MLRGHGGTLGVCDLLTSLYSSFTEAFKTSDLKDPFHPSTDLGALNESSLSHSKPESHA